MPRALRVIVTSSLHSVAPITNRCPLYVMIALKWESMPGLIRVLLVEEAFVFQLQKSIHTVRR